MARARLLALDWGTSSLRAFLLGESGDVVASRRQPWGILQLPEGGFTAALRGLAGDWLGAMPGLPVIASGMVGSAQGWREVPYVTCPADAATLAAGLSSFDAWPGQRLHVVPGVRVGGERPDVMRGEETQVLGVLAQAPAQSSPVLLVMPGTHCKWVRVEAARIVGFHTYMTGELYALLAQHSILGRPAREVGGGAVCGAAFERGVSAVRAQGAPGGLALLFSARALVLGGQLPALESLEYLSGLLVGEELRCALAGSPAAKAPPLTLVGETALCERYRRALALFDVPAQIAADGAARAGLWQIAQRAGLVHGH